MMNLSDKELDRLSREAAGQYEIDENISSWEKLEQELDKEIGTISTTPPSRPGMMALSYSTLILLLAGLSFFLLKNEKNNADLTQKNNPVIVAAGKPAGLAPQPKARENSGGVLIDAKSKPFPQNKRLAKVLPDNGPSTADRQMTKSDNSIQKESTETRNSPAPVESENKATSVHSNTTATGLANKNPQIAEKSNRNPYQRNSINSYTKKPNRSAAANNEVNNSKKEVDPTRITEAETGDAATGRRSSDAAGISAKQPLPALNLIQGGQGKSVGRASESDESQLEKSRLPGIQTTADLSTHISDSSLMVLAAKTNNIIPEVGQSGKKNKQSLRINRPLHIGIILAPDFTDVGSASNDKMSINAGLTLGYHLLNNLSVNSGVIFTLKNYAANGYNFHAPADSWISYVHLNSVQGSCYMIEIPLTLRYDISTIGKTKFFINGGLSSYLMRHESYSYNYTHNGYTHDTSYNYSQRENFWFSTISLSLGLEQQLSKSFSFQVEPFVKIPLGGIGYGNLHLSSYGLGFSFRYTPVLGKSRH